jgi:hypothetical protein
LANRGLVIDKFDFCQIGKSHLAIFNMRAGRAMGQNSGGLVMPSGEHFKMKSRVLQVLVVLGLTGVSLATNVDKANAVVCARGLYRAGCVGPYGRAVVRRAPIAGYYGRRFYGGRVGRVGVIRRW